MVYFCTLCGSDDVYVGLNLIECHVCGGTGKPRICILSLGHHLFDVAAKIMKVKPWIFQNPSRKSTIVTNLKGSKYFYGRILNIEIWDPSIIGWDEDFWTMVSEEELERLLNIELARIS